MNYFCFVPSEINEIILFHLDNRSLKSFILFHNLIDSLRWHRIYFYHFNDEKQMKNLNYSDYIL